MMRIQKKLGDIPRMFFLYVKASEWIGQLISKLFSGSQQAKSSHKYANKTSSVATAYRTWADRIG